MTSSRRLSSSSSSLRPRSYVAAIDMIISTLLLSIIVLSLLISSNTDAFVHQQQPHRRQRQKHKKQQQQDSGSHTDTCTATLLLSSYDDPANMAWRLASLNLDGDAMTTYSTMPTATPTVSPANKIPYHEYKQQQQQHYHQHQQQQSDIDQEEHQRQQQQQQQQRQNLRPWQPPPTPQPRPEEGEQDHQKPKYVPYSRIRNESSSSSTTAATATTTHTIPKFDDASDSVSGGRGNSSNDFDTTTTNINDGQSQGSNYVLYSRPPQSAPSQTSPSSTSNNNNINNSERRPSNVGSFMGGNGAIKDKMSTDRAAQALNNLGAAGWIDSSVKSSVLSGPIDARTHKLKGPPPKLSNKGLYQLTSEDEYQSFLQAHPDKLVVVKFYATYCAACRALEKKFLQVKDDPQLDRLPIVWAEFAVSRDTKDLFRRLGVLTLPTVHFYDGSMLPSMGRQEEQQTNLIENFPCPAAKVPLLKKKLARFLNARVDPETMQLIPLEEMLEKSTRSTTPPQSHGTTPLDSVITADAVPVASSGPPYVPKVPLRGKTLDNIELTAASAFIAATTDNYSKATIDVTDTSSTVDVTPSTIPLAQDTFDDNNGIVDAEVNVDDGNQKRPTIPLGDPVAPRVTRQIVMDNELVTEEHIDYLRHGMPFFRDLSDEEFDVLLSKARLLTFDVGDVICKQGMPGTTFYVLKRGVVEMLIRNRFEDPIRTPPSYLGVVAGELHRGDFFGERALTTGEPLAASFRVVEKVRCFAFKWEDIPESSILSRKRRATREMIEQLDKRYELPADYRPYMDVYSSPDDHGKILDLLVRFKQIRQAAKCWNYIMNTSDMNFGDPGCIARRMMLVSKLSEAQQKEFRDVFDMVDEKKSGMVSLLEMRKFMATAGEQKSDEELLKMIKSAGNSQLYERCSEDAVITRNEFMGVMAEAEFYNLFMETFEELDKEKTGYVRAGDLAAVLGGVQDLVGVGGAQAKTIDIIDSEDSDMLVDYEQFSKMLLGASL